MILYQSLALLLNTKLNLSISGKITVLIVFIDGIITGLLIHFCGHHHHLSIGIGGLFLFVYVRAFSIITFAAITGVAGAIFITTIFPLPLHYIPHSNEVILLNMLGIFFLVFCFVRGCHEKFLNESIRSIINQSFKNWELIAIENGSNDFSKKILMKINDRRINKKFLKKNIGRTNCLNYGLKLCRGEYIAILDSDDIAKINRISLQVNFLKKNKKIDLIAGNYNLINADNKVIKSVRYSNL